MLIGICVAILQMLTLTQLQFIKGSVLDAAMQKNMSLLPQVLLKLCAAMVIISVLEYVFSIINCVFIEKCAYLLRELFFEAFLKRSYKEYFTVPEGELIAKYSKELSIIENNCFAIVGVAVQRLLQIICITAALFYLNIPLALFSLVILSIPLFVPRIFQKKLSKSSENKIINIEANIGIVSGILSSFEVIKNFGIEKNIIERFKKSNKTLMAAENRYEKAYAISAGVSFAVSLGSQACIMIITGVNVYYGYLKTGDFITIAGLVAALKVPLFWISGMFQKIIATKPVRTSIFQFIEIEEHDRKYLLTAHDIKHQGMVSIDIEKLSYAYNDGDMLLNGIDLHFKPQMKYLILGESGCGKSTLMKLLLNYDVLKTGKISINNTDIQDIYDLENIITIARQDAVIFNGTIRDNLTMYNNQAFSDDELITILKKTGLDTFVAKGLHYYLEEKGSNISGGEKKRISLARALVRNTPVLILDEPFANLDQENSDKIEKLLLSIKNKLIIIISHQVSDTLKQSCDYVIELKKGMKSVETVHKI